MVMKKNFARENLGQVWAIRLARFRHERQCRQEAGDAADLLFAANDGEGRGIESLAEASFVGKTFLELLALVGKSAKHLVNSPGKQSDGHGDEDGK